MTPYVRGSETVTWQEAKTDTTFVGVSASYLDVESAEVAQGRFFSDEEERSVARLAVIGSQVAQDLFGDLDPIGQTIRLKKNGFTIIGVMKARGTSGFQNQDNQIFIPLSAAQKVLLGINYVNFIRFKIDKPEDTDAAISYIETVLRERHDINDPAYDDFSVRSTNQGLEALTQITDALKIFLTSIAAISLLVGGIGIMNIMLAAVQERTKEIGLRKALGARRSHITIQFLVETMFITLLGGLIGIALGVSVAALIAFIVGKLGYAWDFVVSPFSIVLSVSVSAIIGFVFGIIPARRASKLDPIEALRYE
jgi:ABC-type antimicrobial peptide transport system permease subunit